MFIGLNLLSQPAQAISVGFSFATNPVTGTIDGLVEGNNTGAGVTATVLSTPTGQYLGGYKFQNIGGGSPNAFIVTNGNITFADRANASKKYEQKKSSYRGKSEGK